MALPFLPSSIDFRRKTGVVTAMREREKMHLMPLVLVMSGMSIRFSVFYIQEFLLDTLPFKGGRHKFFVYITVKRAAVRGSQRAQGEEETELVGRDASDAQEGRGFFWLSVSKIDAKEADTEKAGNRVPGNQ